MPRSCCRFLGFLLIVCAVGLPAGCTPEYEAPPIPLDAFDVEDDFRLEVIASEPLIQDPVAMAFDADGRPWIVEMQGYMRNLEGLGEDQPNGRIVILEDRDGDGRMDHRTVFLDSLVLPRALGFAGDGLLYAEPPNLWYVENRGGRPGPRVLVDSAYAVGGNVEHQPNGLMRALDNWIYSAKSSARYRFLGGRWVKEETEFRGQWGITQDNYGRLFYNDNSNQLQGDLVLPNLLLRNPNHEAGYGTGVQLTDDQRVYPLHATAVNRGYLDGVLDDAGRLRHFTAACGPVIYRGDNFPPEYVGNAFVAEPSANLIKRNLLGEAGARVSARQAYEGREFVASRDEAFRPVNLYNAPDGTLYVVDFYRGIIQHKTYLTPYLTEQIRARSLDTLITGGRIYRLVHQAKTPERPPRLGPLSNPALVPYLAHPNGWLRDTAQRLLVDRQATNATDQLAAMAADAAHPLGQIHALWTLEGLNALTPHVLIAAASASHPKVLAAAVHLAERFAQGAQAAEVLALLQDLAAHPDSYVQLQRALTLGRFAGAAGGPALDLLADVARRHDGDSLFHHAILSSLAGKERRFQAHLSRPEDTALAVHALLEVASLAADAASLPSMPEERPPAITEAQWALGRMLYHTHCSSCHHAGGQGIAGLAPPLRASEYVVGPAQRLVLLVLHGMTGPVTVRGRRYAPPEVQPVMPGLKDNPAFTDERLAALLSYVRHAWGNKATVIRPETIATLRARTGHRQDLFTEEELLHLEPEPPR